MIFRVSAAATTFLALTCIAVPAFAGDAVCDSGIPCPTFVLQGKLQEIFVISHCQLISGLTCKITYNGKSPLPSEVFFTEVDSDGHPAGKKTRLIYPHLNASEQGVATFRIKTAEPAQIVLTGVWDGPWKDPY